MSAAVDRPAAIRRALRELVAERGFHGASMGAVAQRAGVAAGTAYVHYASKDELVLAAFVETKVDLGLAIADGYPANADPYDRWHHVLTRAYRHLSAERTGARFLTQVEESPYFEEGTARLAAAGDPVADLGLVEALAGRLVDLPWEVVYALTFGAVVRLVAAGVELDDPQLDALVSATWRAVTVG